jgi:hypothetical protein
METPREALAKAIMKTDLVPMPSGWRGYEHWAVRILDDLKEEGGWELVKIIPKSKPFTGIYPPGTK